MAAWKVVLLVAQSVQRKAGMMAVQMAALKEFVLVASLADGMVDELDDMRVGWLVELLVVVMGWKLVERLEVVMVQAMAVRRVGAKVAIMAVELAALMAAWTALKSVASSVE